MLIRACGGIKKCLLNSFLFIYKSDFYLFAIGYTLCLDIRIKGITYNIKMNRIYKRIISYFLTVNVVNVSQDCKCYKMFIGVYIAFIFRKYFH